MSINAFWSSMVISENARYFPPGNACCRSDTRYIYALFIFKLPPGGTSDGRFSQYRIHFTDTQSAVERQARQRL